MRTPLLLAALTGAVLVAGCNGPAKDVLVAPQPLMAPYDTRGGELTWAVTPPSNATMLRPGPISGKRAMICAA